MSHICVLGSANLDHVLLVHHIPKPGETLEAKESHLLFGGKVIYSPLILNFLTIHREPTKPWPLPVSVHPPPLLGKRVKMVHRYSNLCILQAQISQG